MHSLARLVASALAVSTTTAVYTGFNYGNTHTDGSIKQQSDYEAEFRTAKNLVGAPGFTSARLYTSVQGNTNNPIAAIPAAIAQDTSLLLGIWASSGQQTIDSEIAALKSAISQYGDSFTSRVAGISVGSEDLYRDSVIGIQTNAGIGAGPDTVSSYIHQVRSALSNSGLSVPIGHVDTWTAWVNGSNQAVIDACDFIGFDGYPYFQNTMPNSIEDAKSLFQDSIHKTKAAVGNKEVWIAETGWPVSGPTENQAVASLQNAETYWDEVGCGLLFGKVNTWWYTLRDAEPQTPSPSFGVVGSDLSTTPLYNLTCSGSSSSNSTSTGVAKPTTGSATSGATGTSSPSGGSGIGGSGSGSATGSSPAGSSTSGSLIPSQGSGSSGSASGSPSASSSGGAGFGSATSKPLISPTPSGGAGSSSSGAMSSPSVSGVASSSGVVNSPAPSASSSANEMGGSTAVASGTAAATGGAGGGVGGGNNQSPSGSSSSPQSSPTVVSAATAASAPVMYLVGAITAIIALL